jgi:multiple sugar transport system ATP-binding protein
MRIELALLHRRLAATMVYVTHDQEEAMTLGTRIAVMRDGALEQVAPPLEVFSRPANVFVAGFVGSPSMNLWPCRTCRRGGEMQLVSRAFSITMDRGDSAIADGQDVLAGVRPHDIELVESGPSDAEGRVEILEPLGPVILGHLRVENLPDHLARIVVSADTPIAVDASVRFRVRRDRLHLFEAGTGRRLPD